VHEQRRVLHGAVHERYLRRVGLSVGRQRVRQLRGAELLQPAPELPQQPHLPEQRAVLPHVRGRWIEPRPVLLPVREQPASRAGPRLPRLELRPGHLLLVVPASPARIAAAFSLLRTENAAAAWASTGTSSYRENERPHHAITRGAPP